MIHSIYEAKFKIEACIIDFRAWLGDHLLKGNDRKRDRQDRTIILCGNWGCLSQGM